MPLTCVRNTNNNLLLEAFISEYLFYVMSTLDIITSWSLLLLPGLEEQKVQVQLGTPTKVLGGVELISRTDSPG